MNIHLCIAIAIALVIPILCLVFVARNHIKQNQAESTPAHLAHLADNQIKPPIHDLRAPVYIGWDLASGPDTVVILEQDTASPPNIDLLDKKGLAALHNRTHF